MERFSPFRSGHQILDQGLFFKFIVRMLLLIDVKGIKSAVHYVWLYIVHVCTPDHPERVCGDDCTLNLLITRLLTNIDTANKCYFSIVYIILKIVSTNIFNISFHFYICGFLVKVIIFFFIFSFFISVSCSGSVSNNFF